MLSSMTSAPSNTEVRLFTRAYLSDATKMVTRVVSAAVPVAGNTITLACTVANIRGTSPSLTLLVEGSYDGQSWSSRSLPTVTLSTPTSEDSNTQTGVDFAFARVRATITSSGGTGHALFNAVLAFDSR